MLCMKSLSEYVHCEWCGRKIMRYKRTYSYRVFTDKGAYVICDKCNFQFVKTDHLPEKANFKEEIK